MLNNFSKEDLEAELEKRKKAQEELEKPKQIPSPDFAPLLKICQDYIDDFAKDGYVDDDYPHYIIEVALTCAFGDGVWLWKRSKRG